MPDDCRCVWKDMVRLMSTIHHLEMVIARRNRKIKRLQEAVQMLDLERNMLNEYLNHED